MKQLLTLISILCLSLLACAAESTPPPTPIPSTPTPRPIVLATTTSNTPIIAPTAQPTLQPALTPTTQPIPPPTVRPTVAPTTTPSATSFDARTAPLFDAHIHYSEDAWRVLSPQEAIAQLRKAGITQALVSSSNDDGTQQLYEAAPDLIIPELRPYRSRNETASWLTDETVIPYLEERLKKYKYVAIGEFHANGADADLPVVRRVVQLAKQHQLWLHAHTDVDGVQRLLRQDPTARILWAHSGFANPAQVRDILRRYPNVYADLAFRNDIASNGALQAGWRELLIELPDRFMLGTDTYTPDRWGIVVSQANWARQWLATLPPTVAERIANKNGEEIFKREFAKGR